MRTIRAIILLHLADDLARFRQRLHHLLAFLSSSNRMLAFLEQIVNFVGPVHLFEELSLHLIFRVPALMSVCLERATYAAWEKDISYWTRLSMIAFGTMSIIVLRVMLKYELISSSVFCVRR